MTASNIYHRLNSEKKMKKLISRNSIVLFVLSVTSVSGTLSYILRYSKNSDQGPLHGNQAYALVTTELTRLSLLGERGDCDAAYKVGRHHLYVSLDHTNAEKYYRIAASCPNVAAKMALVTVLRTQKHDDEVDAILISIKNLNERAWEDTSSEVNRIRATRNIN